MLSYRSRSTDVRVQRWAHLKCDAPIARVLHEPTQIALSQDVVDKPVPVTEPASAATLDGLRIEGSHVSRACIVKWQLSRRRYSEASGCRVGGKPLSASDVVADDALIAIAHRELRATEDVKCCHVGLHMLRGLVGRTAQRCSWRLPQANQILVQVAAKQTCIYDCVMMLYCLHCESDCTPLSPVTVPLLLFVVSCLYFVQQVMFVSATPITPSTPHPPPPSSSSLSLSPISHSHSAGPTLSSIVTVAAFLVHRTSSLTLLTSSPLYLFTAMALLTVTFVLPLLVSRSFPLLLLAALHPASVTSSSTIANNSVASFTADLTAPTTTVTGVLYDSFGSSHGSTTLRSTWRDHLAATRRDIPFQRVRFHGILDDDMSTYLNGQANGALLFDTLDYLVAQRIRPTVEVGFMPELLASRPASTVFHYKGGTSPPASWSRWRAFITQFAQLLVSRYTTSVVRTWRFEVWNEPNCGFWSGNQTSYFQLYAETATAIKAVDQQLQVGGPATCELGWLLDFLAAARATNTPVDFVSSHLYPTDPTLLSSTRDTFMDAVANATAVAHAAGVPFLLTEFNAGVRSAAGSSVRVLDSSYAAAFLLHCHLRAQSIEGLLSMSYWTFTDFGFEEGGVDPQPWNAGYNKFGIQTMYGVKKPAYRAMQWISDWRTGSVVPVKVLSGGGGVYRSVGGAVVGASVGTVDVLVAVADGGVVSVLLGDYDIADGDTPLPATTTVTVTLTGLTAPLPTNATLELIDGTHANPYATWLAAGSPLYPGSDEIEAEVAASVPLPMSLSVESAGAGSVRVTVILASYALARVRMSVGGTPAAAAAAAAVLPSGVGVASG